MHKPVIDFFYYFCKVLCAILYTTGNVVDFFTSITTTHKQAIMHWAMKLSWRQNHYTWKFFCSIIIFWDHWCICSMPLSKARPYIICSNIGLILLQCIMEPMLQGSESLADSTKPSEVLR
jgi:hypothetical protein